MSQFPPPQSPPYGNADPYGAPPKTLGLALAAMILGIVGLPCGLLGIVGLILGIVSLGKISRSPQLYTGKGFAITGIVAGSLGTVLMVPALLIAILLPSLGRARELANRSTCAANMRGIAQSMNIYAAENQDFFPVAGTGYSSTLASSSPGPTGSVDDLLSNKPGMLYAPGAPGNVCQSIWILVMNGQVMPKQFICKSDPTGGTPSAVTIGADFRSNFSDDKSYSYSFAFMWANGGKQVGGWWRSDVDAGLPVIADIAPANGSGSPGANTLNGMDKYANSPNHERDGQNVGYGDGHAEFARLASVGENSDNIYSANGNAGPSATGTTPSSASDPGISYSTGTGGTRTFGGSRGNWDVCLVPAADVASGTRK